MILRFVIVGLVLSASIAAAAAWRMAVHRASTKRSREIVGTRFPKSFTNGSRYLLFTSRYCIPCAELKEALEESGEPWKEITVESDALEFRRLGLRATPVLIELSERGVAQRYWGPDSVDHALAILDGEARSPQTTQDRARRENAATTKPAEGRPVGAILRDSSRSVPDRF